MDSPPTKASPFRPAPSEPIGHPLGAVAARRWHAAFAEGRAGTGGLPARSSAPTAHGGGRFFNSNALRRRLGRLRPASRLQIYDDALELEQYGEDEEPASTHPECAKLLEASSVSRLDNLYAIAISSTILAHHRKI